VDRGCVVKTAGRTRASAKFAMNCVRLNLGLHHPHPVVTKNKKGEIRPGSVIENRIPSVSGVLLLLPARSGSECSLDAAQINEVVLFLTRWTDQMKEVERN
jgi:hypothetical protein